MVEKTTENKQAKTVQPRDFVEAPDTARFGIKTLLLTRLNGDSNAAKNLMYQTDLELSKEADSDSTITKSGSIAQPGGIEVTLSATVIAAVGDKTLKMLEDAFDHQKSVEFWLIDSQNKKTDEDKYWTYYMQGFINTFTMSANAEDLVEVEIEVTVDQLPQQDWGTLSAEQKQLAQYQFVDTVAK